MQLLLQEPDPHEGLFKKILEFFEEIVRGGADVEELLQKLVSNRLVADLQDLVGHVGSPLADKELCRTRLQDLHQPGGVVDVVVADFVDELGLIINCRIAYGTPVTSFMNV